MTRRFRAASAFLTAMIGAGLVACGGGTGSPPAVEDEAATTGLGSAEAMPGPTMGGMAMDPAMMQRYALEMDSLVVRMHQHVEAMRQLPPEEWSARMAEHAPRMAAMLGMMDRHASEMGMGMGMSDERMGAMMGMTPVEHRQMMEEMGTLRSEAEELRTAPEAEVRERMPAHLDRMESMLRTMEEAGGHMHMHMDSIR